MAAASPFRSRRSRNPGASAPATASASLSNPAARPIGLANRRPSTSTARACGVGRPRDRPARPRRSALRARRCARSGSTRRMSGMKADAMAGVMVQDGYARCRAATIAGESKFTFAVSTHALAARNCRHMLPARFPFAAPRALPVSAHAPSCSTCARPAWRGRHRHRLPWQRSGPGSGPARSLRGGGVAATRQGPARAESRLAARIIAVSPATAHCSPGDRTHVAVQLDHLALHHANARVEVAVSPGIDVSAPLLHLVKPRASVGQCIELLTDFGKPDCHRLRGVR